MKKLLALILCWSFSCNALAAVEKKDAFKVGAVQQSILSEAQFQAQNGSGWVKMRGQAIASSRLCVKFTICALPNAEGRFLRDSVADAGIRTTVNDSTAVNTLTSSHDHPSTTSGSVPLKDFGGGNFSGSSSLASPVPLIRAVGTLGQSSSDNHISGYSSGTYTDYTNTTDWPGSQHSHITYIAKSNFDHTHGGVAVNLASISSTLSDGVATETAPDHVIVNTFIKIN